MSHAVRRPVDRAVSFARAIVRLYRDRDVPFMAGSVAYSAFVSLLPLVVLLLIVASVVGGEAFRDAVLSLTDQYLTPTSQGLLADAIANASGRVGISLLGLAALLWAVLKVFRSLDKAFSELYGEHADSSIVDRFTDGVVVLGAITLAVLVMVGVGALVALAPTITIGFGGASSVVRLLGFVALIAGLTLVFLPIYYVFPDAPVTVREVLPGAVIAALGWTALQALFQVYVSLTSANQLYGVIGGVILILTWLYFAAVVVLLGASTNVVLAGRHRPPTYGLVE